MKRWQRYVVPALVTMMLGGTVLAQQVPANNDSTAAEAARVFIECASCDYDFETDFNATLDHFKTEITFVNFVRDRAESDVHVLITTQPTSAGGREITVGFNGRKTFDGMVDTLRCYGEAAAADDAVRSELVRTLKQGLMRFVARTPLARDIAVSYYKPALSTAKIDKWNYWVFSVEANGNFNGEKSHAWAYIYSRIQAQRTTEKNRLTFSFWGNYNEENHDYGNTSAMSVSRSKGANVGGCLGLDDHWSIGLGTDLWSSSYSNYQSVWEFYPLAEYNIFPYSQSTSRQLRLTYLANLRYHDYLAETIYNHGSEWLGQQQLSATLTFVKPWGSTETYVTASHNLPETSMNRIWFGGQLSLNLVKGLSLNIQGQYARIHDQINLIKGEVSEQDILLQRRQLATSYEYSCNIGFRYSFGSIFTNIVNSRFGG